MLSSNPIWFREQQTLKTRNLRLAWWKRGRAALPLVWFATGAVTLLICLVSQRHTSMRDLQEVLEVAVVASCYLQVAYLSFRAVLAGSSALVRERELQTMDTLLSSPLPARDLTIGKWAVAAIPLWRETTLALPVAFLMFAGSPHVLFQAAPGYDSLHLWQLGDIYLFSIVLVTALTGLGLALSTRAVNSGRASAHAVFAGLMMVIGTYIVDMLIEIFTRVNGFEPILCYLNPFSALYSILWGGARWSGSEIGPFFWIGTVVLYGAVAAVTGGLALQRLRRPLA